MTKLLLLDLDGTVRRPKSGATFINRPTDQQIIPAAAKGIAHAASQGWRIVGCSNQGGVAASKKSLVDAIEEQEVTLRLEPLIEKIYFCPTFDGLECWKIDRHQKPTSIKQRSIEEFGSFRKPGAGMLLLALKEMLVGNKKGDIWMIGDRPEDLAAATAAGVQFLPAELWHQRFSPGFNKMRRVTAKQLEFLEGVKYEY